MDKDEYQPIIGLEIHVQLQTKSKMFCGCDANWFGKEPNTHCCPVCLGLPGALPVPNKKAIEWCVLLGMALNCTIPEFSKFDRKNYFYPDLPKGYQISQYDKPFCTNGYLEINTSPEQAADKPREKIKVRIRRVHLEEDTGKLIHADINGEKCTLIDFNRSGVPLVEIVTEPDLKSGEQVSYFLKKLRQIIRYLGISNADMEKGSLRIEPNVSVKMIGNGDFKNKSKKRNARLSADKLPPYKVEIKNINSFNFAKRAIDYEIKRQIKLLEKGKIPRQETRGWDEKKGKTVSQRGKEEAHDYRYFPEPDIPPIRWSQSELNRIRQCLVELPDETIRRLIKHYKLRSYDAEILAANKQRVNFFEKAVKLGKKYKINAKLIANWIINKKTDIAKVSVDNLIKKIIDKERKKALPEKKLKKICTLVIEKNKQAVRDYQAGKVQALGFLIGQVMKETKGKADAKQAKAELTKQLKGNL